MTTKHSEPPKPGDIDVGDKGPTLVVENVARKEFVKYAGASGDFNPLHVVEPYAKNAGNDSVFGHGMLTAGYASRMVTEWVGLANVQQFKTRFIAKLWPGDTLTVTGEIVDKSEEDGSVVVDVKLEVTNQDDEVLLTGTASAALPEK
jgi:peroxisomal enoyl-CoA hydratase 2